MKEIKLKGLNQTIYKEKTKNNLDIYMIPYDNKEGFTVNIITKYGSNNINFIPKNKKEFKTFPLGIAHFLEHKLFEQKDGIDPFMFAAEKGLDCNAFTSNVITSYYLSGTNHFDEALEYLLNLVYEINLTDENIEKEKGIIIEELKMYMDNIDFKIDLAMKSMLYHNHPNKDDVGGTIESVKSITKEDLLECYESFYEPSNMFMVISGNFNIDNTLKIINDNKLLKEKNSSFEISNQIINEPLKVKEEYKEIFENITNNKLCYAVKIPYANIDKFVFRSYIKNYLSIKIGNISEFQYRLKKEQKLNFLGYDIEDADDKLIIYIFIETDDYKYLINELDKELSNKIILKEDLERQKKVQIAKEVSKTDYFNIMANLVVSDVILSNKVYENRVDLIRGLNIEEFSSIIESIDFTNKSVLVVKPKNN